MRRVSKLLLFLVALATSSVSAQPVARMPRYTSNALGTTQTLPTTTSPAPETNASNTCIGCQGQSATVPGALHLNGCYSYQITLRAASGQTLSGAGSLKILFWSDQNSPTEWARNPGLDETVTVAATTTSQTFLAHLATGTGWIYAAPSGVTVSGGTTVTVTIEALCAY